MVPRGRRAQIKRVSKGKEMRFIKKLVRSTWKELDEMLDVIFTAILVGAGLTVGVITALGLMTKFM